MELQITVDDSKAKHFLAFLKDLDFVEVSKPEGEEKPEKKKKKKPTFAYFDSCPDWDIDAAELRRQSNHRAKAQW